MKKNQNSNDAQTIPYIVFESVLTRYERTIRNLIIVVIVTIVLLFSSNAIWVYQWTQYDYSSEESTIDVDAKDGTANYIGNDGDINNGEDKSNEKSTSKDKEK